MGDPVAPAEAQVPANRRQRARQEDDFPRVAFGYVMGLLLALVITGVDALMVSEALRLFTRHQGLIDGSVIGFGFSLFHGLLLGLLPVLGGVLLARRDRVSVAWQCWIYPLGLGALLLIKLPLFPLWLTSLAGGGLGVGITRYVTARRPPEPPA